jgi:hypothetical protein
VEKVHGPGKTNKEIFEKKDQEEGMGDEDKENENDDMEGEEMRGEDDDMEGSGADDNKEEAERSTSILSGGDQRYNDTDRNRSSPELGQHGVEEQAMEETVTVAPADESADEVEEEQGESSVDGRADLICQCRCYCRSLHCCCDWIGEEE